MRNALSNDIGILMNNPPHSDVTFLVDGKSIYAHRSILIAVVSLWREWLKGL